MHDAKASPALISKVTDGVMDEVIQWQSRPLEAVCPIIYLDGIVVKVRQDKQVINKFIFLALGVNLQGRKNCWACGLLKTGVRSSGCLF